MRAEAADHRRDGDMHTDRTMQGALRPDAGMNSHVSPAMNMPRPDPLRLSVHASAAGESGKWEIMYFSN